MSNDTLFPEESNEAKFEIKREKTLQQKLMEYLRAGNVINEEIYNNELGGYSLSSTVRNCEQRGLLEDGEYIYPYWVYDKSGEKIRHFKLVLAYSEEQIEAVVEERVKERLKALESALEPIETADLAHSFLTPPSKLFDLPPELTVESIYVGANKGLPEIMVVLEGMDKPIRKIILPRDAKYLISALSPFVKE